MAKYFGPIGFVEHKETSPGVYEEVSVEKSYSGDVLRNSRRWEAGENLNDNLTIANTISIIADDYACEHFFAIRYLYWMGTYWKVTSVSVEPPRLVLSIGGVYNGNTAGIT